MPLVGRVVGGSGHDAGVAGPQVLRRIVDPVVAAAPAGVRIRTRIHPTAEEAATLAAIGSFLGSLYRGELAERIDRGVLDRPGIAGVIGIAPSVSRRPGVSRF